MICLDCLNNPRGPWPLGTSTDPVVAICHDCGAAVCKAHAVIEEESLTAVMAINRQVAVEPAARRIRCHQCAAAEHSRQRIEGKVAVEARGQPA